jgi:hypothetical protein
MSLYLQLLWMPYLGNSEIQSTKNCNLNLSLYLTFKHSWWPEATHKITKSHENIISSATFLADGQKYCLLFTKSRIHMQHDSAWLSVADKITRTLQVEEHFEVIYPINYGVNVTQMSVLWHNGVLQVHTSDEMQITSNKTLVRKLTHSQLIIKILFP